MNRDFSTFNVRNTYIKITLLICQNVSKAANQIFRMAINLVEFASNEISLVQNNSVDLGLTILIILKEHIELRGELKAGLNRMLEKSFSFFSKTVNNAESNDQILIALKIVILVGQYVKNRSIEIDRYLELFYDSL